MGVFVISLNGAGDDETNEDDACKYEIKHVIMLGDRFALDEDTVPDKRMAR